MKKILVGFISIALVLVFCFSLVSAQSAGTGTGTNTGTGDTTDTVGCPNPTDIANLFSYAICILQSYVVPFLIGLAVVLFLAGIVKYVASGDNEEKRDAGKGLMVFGVIALFVMIGVWGLVKILYVTILPGRAFEVPNLPPQSTNPFQ